MENKKDIDELEQIKSYSLEELKYAIFDQCVYLNEMYTERGNLKRDDYPNTEEGETDYCLDVDIAYESCKRNRLLLEYMFECLMNFNANNNH